MSNFVYIVILISSAYFFYQGIEIIRKKKGWGILNKARHAKGKAAVWLGIFNIVASVLAALFAIGGFLGLFTNS